MRTFVIWLKSTLLLKMKCHDTYIYKNRMFTNKNEKQHCLGGKGKDRVALIKSLIYGRVRSGALRDALYKRSKQTQSKYIEIVNW